MIKREQTLKKEDVLKALFNIAGCGLVGGVAIYMVTSAFQDEEVPLCSARYASFTELSLSSENGSPLTPIEFHAGLSSDAENITENAEVVSVPDGNSAGTALKVRLAEQPETGSKIAGIKFHWSPNSLENSRSGCLTYKTKLPENLDFTRAGFLPGFTGGGVAENREGAIQPFEFASQLGWSETGQPLINVARTGFVQGWTYYLKFSARDPIPTGRWIQLEQEIITNTPGEHDGVYRLWVDGKLAVNQTSVGWAPKGSAMFRGVTGKIGLQAKTQSGYDDETKQQFVHVSPFQLRWE